MKETTAEQDVSDAVANDDDTVDAVYVRNATKCFGVGKRRAPVFRKLDMTVKRGAMYVHFHLHFIHWTYKHLSRLTCDVHFLIAADMAFWVRPDAASLRCSAASSAGGV